LLDLDNSGSVTPKDIGVFFEHIFDDETTRLKINEISKPLKVDSQQYKLVEQICIESGLDYYFGYFFSEGITTHIFLEMTADMMKAALPKLLDQHVAVLILKIKDYMARK